MFYTVIITTRDAHSTSRDFLTETSAKDYFNEWTEFFSANQPAYDTTVTLTDDDAGTDLEKKFFKGSCAILSLTRDNWMVVKSAVLECACNHEDDRRYLDILDIMLKML